MTNYTIKKRFCACDYYIKLEEIFNRKKNEDDQNFAKAETKAKPQNYFHSLKEQCQTNKSININ